MCLRIKGRAPFDANLQSTHKNFKYLKRLLKIGRYYIAFLTLIAMGKMDVTVH
jgi:hypothetical protein